VEVVVGNAKGVGTSCGNVIGLAQGQNSVLDKE
jgi:hypothetical protein